MQDELGGKKIQDFSTDLTRPDTARSRLHHIALHAEEQGGDRLHRGPSEEQQPEREREPQPAPQARLVHSTQGVTVARCRVQCELPK